MVLLLDVSLISRSSTSQSLSGRDKGDGGVGDRDCSFKIRGEIGRKDDRGGSSLGCWYWDSVW